MVEDFEFKIADNLTICFSSIIRQAINLYLAEKFLPQNLPEGLKIDLKKTP